MKAEPFGPPAPMRLQWRPSLSRNRWSRKRPPCSVRCLKRLPIRLTAVGQEQSFVNARFPVHQGVTKVVKA